MKKLVLRDWIKYLIIFLVMILVSYGVSTILLSKSNDFEKKATACDKEKGSMCDFYEVRQYLIHNDSDKNA